jgi:hypothetical protein
MKYDVYRRPSMVDFLWVLGQLPEEEVEQFEIFTGHNLVIDEVAATFYGRQTSWVLTADKEPIVIAGYDELRPGVWQDWLFSTPAAWSEAHWRTVTRRCRAGMDAMLEAGAHRLQCVSLASRIQAHRWYRPLGLEQEGVLRGYGVNGEDAIMFARVR